MNKLLNTREVCEILGVHINKVYELIHAGRLKARKLDGRGKDIRRVHWRIKQVDLEAFIEAGAGSVHTDSE